jgi:hypothetical protein
LVLSIVSQYAWDDEPAAALSQKMLTIVGSRSRSIAS